jgi:Uma2 family endonuclease
MAAPKSESYTVDQYLVMERAAHERHIFVDGEVFAMAGESSAHADITANLMGIVVNRLRGTPCRARTKDTKVRSGRTPLPVQSTSGMFSYPDIVVICGEPEYHDAFQDIVLNPTAIMEVLSPSTEAFDRGYQKWNPSLREYVLVSQDQAQVEVFTRQADGKWEYVLYTGLDATVVLPSIRCTLKLADVYDRVRFPVME